MAWLEFVVKEGIISSAEAELIRNGEMIQIIWNDGTAVTLVLVS